jgi:hypothetical protein
MKPQEAIKVIAEVCASFQGTLAQHQTIQTALKTLEELVPKATGPKKPSDK